MQFRVRALPAVRFVLSLALLVTSSTARLHAEDEEPPKQQKDWFIENYTKREHRIPMRDGVKLFTVVYTPKDRTKDYPILLHRTPYNLKPYTVDAGAKPSELPDEYVHEKFIFALQDVRGRFASEGEFVDVRPHKPKKSGPKDTDESTDAWDTIDWLVKNIPRNNGCVGLQGISYPGFFAALGMVDSHPALKAVSPQAPVADLYDGDDALHCGGFWLAHNFGFFTFFGGKFDNLTRQDPPEFDFGTPDGYEFFLRSGTLIELGQKHFKGENRTWDYMMSNITNAAWCAKHNITPHLKNVRAAVLSVGGWFDAEDLSGTLKTYRALEKQNPGIYNALVMGPWDHGGWHDEGVDSLGPVEFHSDTAEYFRKEIEMPFWRRYLKGETETVLPEAWVFETGRNEWRRETEWPPATADAKALYFHPDGKLSFDPPTETRDAFDEYVSDPNRPVPFTEKISPRMPKTYMVEDQRFAARRPDVLVYQTEPLTEDVTIAGPISASLFVSTTGTDSDWVVKLIDVYTGDHPDSGGVEMGHYQQLVRGEPLRGKFREGLDKPKPFEPGKVTKLEWVMPDVCHTFRTGHRIMVQVQGSWFPLLDRNPQKFCDIYRAKPEDFQKATQRIHRTKATPSLVRVNVLPQERGE